MNTLSDNSIRFRRVVIMTLWGGVLALFVTGVQAQELKLPKEEEGSVPSLRLYEPEPQPIQIHDGSSSGGALSTSVPVIVNRETANSAHPVEASQSSDAVGSASIGTPLEDRCREQTSKLSAEDQQHQGALFGDRCPLLEKAE